MEIKIKNQKALYGTFHSEWLGMEYSIELSLADVVIVVDDVIKFTSYLPMVGGSLRIL